MNRTGQKHEVKPTAVDVHASGRPRNRSSASWRTSRLTPGWRRCQSVQSLSTSAVSAVPEPNETQPSSVRAHASQSPARTTST